MIIFASMDGCGHCQRAKKELENEISKGEVMVVTPEEAKSMFKQELRGFPAFKNTDTNVEVVGFRSKEDLMNRLGVKTKEKYSMQGNPKIIFFVMKGCHYCKKSLELLDTEISAGNIELVDSSMAPKEATGFPFFMNMENGKTTSGLPMSVSDLYEKLEYEGKVEGYEMNGKRQPGNAKIVFFAMRGHPGCQKTVELLQKEIASGNIDLVDSSMAPRGVMNFPFFMNMENGKTIGGVPMSVSDLYEKLEYKGKVEGYAMYNGKRRPANYSREGYRGPSNNSHHGVV